MPLTLAERESLETSTATEYEIAENLYVVNADWVINVLKNYYDSDSTMDDIKLRVEHLPSAVVYFTDSLQRTTPDKALFAWIDTGVKDVAGNVVWVCLFKSHGQFSGGPVGLSGFVLSKISNLRISMPAAKEKIKRFEEKYMGGDTFETTECESSVNPIIEDIKRTLLVDNWETAEGLEKALNLYGARAYTYVKNGQTEYYVKNGIGSIIINTGLLDRYGNPILVMYRIHQKNDIYYPYMYITSRSQYMDNGFTKEDAVKGLRPVSFIESDLTPFSTNLQDYETNFSHCISDRRDRFPDNVKDTPDLYLAQKITSELSLGLAIHKVGGYYARPLYKPKEHELHWLLPLHINTQIHESPELVMAIRKSGEFYEVATLLPYDTGIRDKLRAAQPFVNLW